jgi:crossover junction endodeoxyribonuclease RuvC
MTTIGIDPGMKGGFAWITDDGESEAGAMPVVGKEISVKGFAHLIDDCLYIGSVSVYIEKVGAMPKQGVVSTFNFGKGFGKLLGAMEAFGVPVHLVTPQAWKKEILAGLDWKGNKGCSCEYVARAYPHIDLTPGKKRKPHDGIADAVCIAEYGARRIGSAGQ